MQYARLGVAFATCGGASRQTLTKKCRILLKCRILKCRFLNASRGPEEDARECRTEAHVAGCSRRKRRSEAGARRRASTIWIARFSRASRARSSSDVEWVNCCFVLWLPCLGRLRVLFFDIRMGIYPWRLSPNFKNFQKENEIFSRWKHVFQRLDQSSGRDMCHPTSRYVIQGR